MIKLFLAFSIFFVTGIVACIINSNKMKTFKYIMKWIFGFIGLILLDLFFETVIFEWLNWNGTSKNDWFFMLWWVLVLSWYLYGLKRIFQHSTL